MEIGKAVPVGTPPLVGGDAAPPPPVAPPLPDTTVPAFPPPPSEPSFTPPAAGRRRPRRAVAVVLAVALVAGAAGVAGWRVLRPSGPAHPSAWDPRVADLVTFVEHERHLTYRHPVAIDFLSDDEFNQKVTTPDRELSAKDRKKIEQMAGMFRALGLIDGNVDLLAAVNKFQSEAALAFYDPKTERVRVRGTDLTVKVRATLVHEMTHALQDQYFDLSREGDFPVDAQNDTYRPVFEGDAEHVEHQWVQALNTGDREIYDKALEAESASVDLSGVPAAVVQFFAAPYNFGEPFVNVLVDASGQKAVDDALRDPPRSDAELLDPFRYLDHQSPIVVDKPALAAGERKTDDGAFGAIALYLVLAQRLDPGRALAATDAWGGDAYVNFVRDGLGCVRADFTGKDAAGTTLLADTLQGWADGLPSHAASISRRQDLVEVNSCDPGGAAARSATGDLAMGVTLAVSRTQVALSLMNAGVPATEARCMAGRFLAAFSPAELPALLGATSPEGAPASTRTRMEAAAQACTAGR